ncbi:OmpA family protein [Mariniflexile sp.]|uniref:OmpA family protein n=1 Tax=Mariniflexile sp. TaxID=1979402 RepID=UPI00356222E9
MYKLFLLLISLFSLTVGAQLDSTNQSIIRLSEKDLNAIITRIVEAKQRHYKIRNLIDNQPVNSDNLRLNADINLLYKKVESLETVFGSLNTKTIMPSQSFNENLPLKTQLEVLQLKIDSLNWFLDIYRKNDPSLRQETIRPINTKMNRPLLQTEIDSITTLIKKRLQTEKQQKNLNILDSTPSAYILLSKKYGDFKSQLYFENNSVAIDTSQTEIIRNVVSILKDNDNIDVLLKGFTSNKGSALHNQNLSMRRTESVKTALVALGVHPTRIVSMYHGVDYKANTEQEARRVDITFIIRK